MNSNRQGWIKLHRKMVDSAVWQSDGLYKLWCYILFACRYEPGTVAITRKNGVVYEVALMPGDMIFGRRSVGLKLGVHQNTAYNRLKKLTELKMVCTKNKTDYTLVTVRNWGVYQNGEESETGVVVQQTSPDAVQQAVQQPVHIEKREERKKTTTTKPKTEDLGKSLIEPSAVGGGGLDWFFSKYRVVGERGITEKQIKEIGAANKGQAKEILCSIVEACRDDAVKNPIAVIPARLERGDYNREIMAVVLAGLNPRKGEVCACGAGLRRYSTQATGNTGYFCDACRMNYRDR